MSKNDQEHLLHDQLTHYLLQHREFALLFFQTILDDDTVKDIQWDTFQRLHDRHTSENLHATVNDMAYTVLYQNSRLLHLIFVLEHKSYLPNQAYPIQYQLQYYAGQHMKRYFDDKAREAATTENEAAAFPTPQPLLIVIYHGKRPWNVPTLAQYYSKAKANAFLQSQVMHIPYVLVDLNKRTDQEIIAFYGKAISFCAGLLALKHVWDDDLLPVIKQLDDLYSQEQATEPEASKRQAVFVYLLRALHKRDDFDRVIDY